MAARGGGACDAPDLSRKWGRGGGGKGRGGRGVGSVAAPPRLWELPRPPPPPPSPPPLLWGTKAGAQAKGALSLRKGEGVRENWWGWDRSEGRAGRPEPSPREGRRKDGWGDGGERGTRQSPGPCGARPGRGCRRDEGRVRGRGCDDASGELVRARRAGARCCRRPGPLLPILRGDARPGLGPPQWGPGRRRRAGRRGAAREGRRLLLRRDGGGRDSPLPARAPVPSSPAGSLQLASPPRHQRMEKFVEAEVRKCPLFLGGCPINTEIIGQGCLAP